MYRAAAHAALHDLIARNWRIDAAGQQKRRAPAGAHRHSADRLDFLDAEIGIIANLDVELMLRIVNVHRKLRIGIEHAPADFLTDFHRIQRKALIRTPTEHLERALIIAHHLDRLFRDRVQILFHFHRRADRMNAENLRNAVDTLLKIREIGDINARVRHPNLAADRLYRFFYIVVQHFQKVWAICAL